MVLEDPGQPVGDVGRRRTLDRTYADVRFGADCEPVTPQRRSNERFCWSR
jgi:hypothetical protein